MGDQSRFDRVDKQLGVRESRSATLRVGSDVTAEKSYQQKLVKPMRPFKLSISLTCSCQQLFSSGQSSSSF